MAAYHVMAVALGQAGQLRELLQLIESLKVGPPQPIKFIPLINWDATLHPDIVVYNAVSMSGYLSQLLGHFRMKMLKQ